MRRAAPLLTLLLLMPACASTPESQRPAVPKAEEMRRLALVISEDESFAVMRPREPTSTKGIGAAAGGLLGLLIAHGVEEGQRSSSDQQATESLVSAVAGIVPRDRIALAVRDGLREGGRPLDLEALDKEPEGDARESYDGVISITVRRWGLRGVLPVEAQQLAGFVELKASLRQRDGTHVWDEETVVLGRGRHTLLNYQHDTELARHEIDEAFETAGLRVAMRLAFPKENPR